MQQAGSNMGGMRVRHGRVIAAIAGVLASVLVVGAVAQAQPAAAPAPAPVAAPRSQPVTPQAVTPQAVTPLAHVETVGTGPMHLILIPDNGASWEVWRGFMARNAERYTMHAVTLPGFAGTEAPPVPEKENFKDLTFSRNAQAAVAQFIRERGLQKPVLVGHGYGAMVALRVAQSNPELVGQLVSISGLPYIPLQAKEEAMTKEDRTFMIDQQIMVRAVEQSEVDWRNGLFKTLQGMVSDDNRARELAEQMLRSDRGVMVYVFAESLYTDLRPGMASSRIPSLFIAPMPPNPDNQKTEFERKRWADIIGAPPNATLVFYSDCRHYVMDDNAQQLDTDMALFLSGGVIPGSMMSPDQSGRTGQPIPVP